MVREGLWSPLAYLLKLLFNDTPAEVSNRIFSRIASSNPCLPPSRPLARNKLLLVSQIQLVFAHNNNVFRAPLHSTLRFLPSIRQCCQVQICFVDAGSLRAQDPSRAADQTKLDELPDSGPCPTQSPPGRVPDGVPRLPNTFWARRAL